MCNVKCNKCGDRMYGFGNPGASCMKTIWTKVWWFFHKKIICDGIYEATNDDIITLASSSAKLEIDDSQSYLGVSASSIWPHMNLFSSFVQKKCDYCKRLYETGRTNCISCGAPYRS